MTESTLRTFARAARSLAIGFREADRRTWIPRTIYVVLVLVWRRGIVIPLAVELDNLRHWLGRGKVGSPYWTPRPGDWAHGCKSGAQRVKAVSIRGDWVEFEDGLMDGLRECVDPARPPREGETS